MRNVCSHWLLKKRDLKKTRRHFFPAGKDFINIKKINLAFLQKGEMGNSHTLSVVGIQICTAGKNVVI